MSITASIERRPDGLFQPATAYDAEVLGSLKIGRGYKVEVKQHSNRSYQHHKLFFGGLLPLAYEYWQPESGLITQGEETAVMGFAKRLEALRDTGGLWLEYAGDYLADIARKRGEKIGAVVADIEVFRKWLIVKAGYFTIVQTPDGIRKEPMSISFHAMGQEEFNAFYKRCFDVVWNMMLNAVFESEAAAQEAAVQKMMELGS